MSWRDEMFESIATWLKQYVKNADLVYAIGEEKSGDRCDTCYGDSIHFTIYYLTNKGRSCMYEYEGSFTELMKEIT